MLRELVLRQLASDDALSKRSLSIGKDADGNFVSVDDCKKGFACGAFCPVCGGALSAKQGEVVEWHFAHQPGSHCNRRQWVIAQGRDLLRSWLLPGSKLLLPNMLKFGSVGRTVIVEASEDDDALAEFIAVKSKVRDKGVLRDLRVVLKPRGEAGPILDDVATIRIDVAAGRFSEGHDAQGEFLEIWDRRWIHISDAVRPPSAIGVLPDVGRVGRDGIGGGLGSTGGSDVFWRKFWMRGRNRRR